MQFFVLHAGWVLGCCIGACVVVLVGVERDPSQRPCCCAKSDWKACFGPRVTEGLDIFITMKEPFENNAKNNGVSADSIVICLVIFHVWKCTLLE